MLKFVQITLYRIIIILIKITQSNRYEDFLHKYNQHQKKENQIPVVNNNYFYHHHQEPIETKRENQIENNIHRTIDVWKKKDTETNTTPLFDKLTNTNSN